MGATTPLFLPRCACTAQPASRVFLLGVGRKPYPVYADDYCNTAVFDVINTAVVTS